MAIKRQITIWAVGERMPKTEPPRILLVRITDYWALMTVKDFNKWSGVGYMNITHWCELPEIETAFEKARKESE